MAKIVSSIITDAIELTDAGGNTIKTIPYRINVTAIAGQVVKQGAELAKLAASPDTDALGRKAIELITLIFGAEVVHELLAHYGDDTVAMLYDITPIIVDQVLPVINRLRQQAVAARKRAKHG